MFFLGSEGGFEDFFGSLVVIYSGGFLHRLEDLGLQQDQEKSEKITTWQTWIIRMRKLQDKCQAKTNELKEANEPQNKKEVEEQMVLVKVRTSFLA